ncbi:unnamed protein product [Cochlearia groenlandica]
MYSNELKLSLSLSPILIFDGEEEDDATPPPFSSKRARKNPTPTDTDPPPPGSASTLFLVDDDDEIPLSHDSRCLSRSSKRVISIESDSPPRPPEYDSLKQRCGVEHVCSDSDSDNNTDWMQGASFQYSLLSHAVKADSDQVKEGKSIEKMGRQKKTGDSKFTSLSVDALPKKQTLKDEKMRASEEKKLRKEQEKLQKVASKAEDAEHKKMEMEKKKWQKGKALKSIIAVIDNKVVEGSVVPSLISGLSEKGITYRVTPNPIKKSIVWSITLPEDIAQTLPLGPKIPYGLLVYEAEDFCNLVANDRLLENISRVREQYPSYTVCYLTNQLKSYIKTREGVAYKNPGNNNGWRKPPVDEVFANLATHYIGVHSRHCVDKAEVAEHVVGLTSNYEIGFILDKLRALVSIPKTQPRHTVAVSKKYPSTSSYGIHDKEFLLKDLKVEGIVSGDKRLGEVCSKRIYRVFMSPCGSIKTGDVENGVASFTDGYFCDLGLQKV